MQREGLRSTEQRRQIVDTFLRSTVHVSIDELLAKVRSADPGIGYATVYRTLKLLCASGVATEHHFGDGLSRYEVADRRGHHDHLICVSCGKIIEFEDEQIEERQQQIAARYHFVILDHKHELYGRCERCAAERWAAERETSG